FRKILERDPTLAAAEFAVGCILLSQDDAQGVTHLEAAMERDADAILPACELLLRYHRTHGNARQAGAIIERGRARQLVLQEAAAERQHLETAATYLPHGLGPDVVEALRGHLAAYPEIRRACLVRKQVRHLPGQPLFALGLRGVPFFGKRTGVDPELVQKLAREIP